MIGFEFYDIIRDINIRFQVLRVNENKKIII